MQDFMKNKMVHGGIGILMLFGLSGCAKEKFEIGEDLEKSPEARFETVIHLPDGLGTARTHLRTLGGQSKGVACSTCHSMDEQGKDLVRVTEDLEEFHVGMQFAHGSLACQSCHHPDDRDQLRLASGDSIPFAQVMDLCGQCHGPQTRDYHKGSHGGMKGYWDQSRGPRERNSCLHCHDAHVPKFQPVMPVFPPRDRFIDEGKHD